MITFNFWFLLFLIISSSTFLADYLIYIFHINYILAIIFSFSLITLLNVFFKKKKIFNFKFDFDVLDLLCFMTLLIIFNYRISIPDFLYDTANYHIYLQQNFPIQKINFDFFAGNIINSFLFPLGDRIHYIFRYFLGYRLGTIFSYISAIIIYYEIKNIINLFTNNKLITSIFAYLSLFLSILVNIWINKYYIDIISIIPILEIIYIYLSSEKLKDDESHNLFILISFITGIASSIKITNLILIFPIIILCLIKFKPDLKALLLSIIMGLLPLYIYIIDNLIQTGSFLFPYYNNILKSKYFGYYAWKDTRFGIPNIFQKLLWPIIVSIFKKGYGDDWTIIDPIWAIGYIFLIVNFLRILKNKNFKSKLSSLTYITIFETIFWIIFLEGYMRYALVVPILYVTLMSICTIKYFLNFKIEFNKGFIKLLYKFQIFLFSIVLIFTIYKAYNNSILLKDKNVKKIEIDGVWGTISDNSALTVLLRNPDVPIYNLNRNLFISSKKSLNLYCNKIINNNIYILVEDYRDLQITTDLMSNNFEIILLKKYNFEEIPYLNKDNELYLYKVTYNKNKKECLKI